MPVNNFEVRKTYAVYHFWCTTAVVKKDAQPTKTNYKYVHGLFNGLMF